MAPTSAVCRRSSGTPISKPRKCTPMSQTGISVMCIRNSTGRGGSDVLSKFDFDTIKGVPDLSFWKKKTAQVPLRGCLIKPIFFGAPHAVSMREGAADYSRSPFPFRCRMTARSPVRTCVWRIFSASGTPIVILCSARTARACRSISARVKLPPKRFLHARNELAECFFGAVFHSALLLNLVFECCSFGNAKEKRVALFFKNEEHIFKWPPRE